MAYNLETKRTVVIPRHSLGAIPNLSVGLGDWLIDREITEQDSSKCAMEAPLGCFSWRIWAIDLVHGKEHLLAESRQAGPQFNNPIPAVGDGLVAWQEADTKGVVATMVDRPQGGARRTLATGIASSQLSLAGGILFLDDGSTDPPRLIRVRLPRGEPEVVISGLKFYRPRATGGTITLVSGLPTERMAVLLAPTGDATRRRELFHSDEVYNAWPLDADSALVSDYEGLHRAQHGEPPRKLSLSVRTPSNIAVKGTVVACIVDGEEGSFTVKLVDLGGR